MERCVLSGSSTLKPLSSPFIIPEPMLGRSWICRMSLLSSFANRGQNWVFGIPLGAVSFADKDTLLAGAYNLTQSIPQPPIDVSYVHGPRRTRPAEALAYH